MLCSRQKQCTERCDAALNTYYLREDHSYDELRKVFTCSHKAVSLTLTQNTEEQRRFGKYDRRPIPHEYKLCSGGGVKQHLGFTGAPLKYTTGRVSPAIAISGGIRYNNTDSTRQLFNETKAVDSNEHVACFMKHASAYPAADGAKASEVARRYNNDAIKPRTRAFPTMTMDHR